MATYKREIEYNGFEITSLIRPANRLFYICENGEKITQMCLGTVKACKNVIDTYIKSLNRKYA